MSYYIYKICCDDLPDFVYVGSTKAFRERKRRHKSNCNDNNNIKLYQTIRENGGWENWRMVVIEECGEISLTQVRIKEEENRVKLNANLNMLRCHRTEEEVKEYNNERAKEYRENNKERIQEKLKKKFTCECGNKNSIKNKKRHEESVFHKKYLEEIED